MQPSINVGIIGCGETGRIHARCIKELGTAAIRGLCDVDETRARSLQPFSPDAYVCTIPEQILRDDSIDAVYVCTHNDSHAQLGMAAARAGKHVLMEKPVAMSLRECDDLLSTVERSGVRFMTAFKLRFYPSVQRVREFIPSPHLCIAQMSDERWPDSFWANDPVQGGGNVLSQGCHAADMLCHLLGNEPVTVSAAGGNYHHPGLGITDALAMTVTFSNGAAGSLVVGDLGLTPLVSKLSFQVMDGTRTAHLHDRLKQVSLWDGKLEQRFTESEELGFLEENREFHQIVNGHGAPSATLRHGIRATVLLLRAIESMRTGRLQSAQL
ncbi:MAG: Gfo/Idh/MocA family oxidoreductase [Bacteroidota bacterium]